jgi:hypothetical protein
MSKINCVLILAFCGVLGGCYSISPTTVTVFNASTKPVEAVTLESYQHWKTTPVDLQAGETKHLAMPVKTVPAEVFLGYRTGKNATSNMDVWLPSFIQSGYRGELKFTIYSDFLAVPDTVPPTHPVPEGETPAGQMQ